MPTVAIGNDHAGYPLKQDLKQHLKALGHLVEDFGTDSEEPVDYPAFSAASHRLTPSRSIASSPPPMKTLLRT